MLLAACSDNVTHAKPIFAYKYDVGSAFGSESDIDALMAQIEKEHIKKLIEKSSSQNKLRGIGVSYSRSNETGECGLYDTTCKFLEIEILVDPTEAPNISDETREKVQQYVDVAFKKLST
jgi:hypothetical protein